MNLYNAQMGGGRNCVPCQTNPQNHNTYMTCCEKCSLLFGKCHRKCQAVSDHPQPTPGYQYVCKRFQQENIIIHRFI